MKSLIHFLTLSCFFLALPATAQSELHTDDKNLVFRPGLYLSFRDFITNNPVVVESVELEVRKNHQFYYDLLNEDVITIYHGDSAMEVDPRYIWGFADGRSVYVNKMAMPVNLLEIRDDSKTPWARVNIVGTICLIHYLPYISGKVIHHPGTNFGLSSSRARPSEYLLDTRAGKFYRPTLSNLAELISDDLDLYEELRNNEEDKVVRFYKILNKYNAKHPIVSASSAQIP